MCSVYLSQKLPTILQQEVDVRMVSNSQIQGTGLELASVRVCGLLSSSNISVTGIRQWYKKEHQALPLSYFVHGQTCSTLC